MRWTGTLRGSALAMQTPRAIARRGPGAFISVEKFSVPDVARGEFEVAMRRTMGVIEKLPGFLVHAMFEKSATEFNVVILVACESRAALEQAAMKTRSHRDEMGFDLPSTLLRWRIKTETRIFTSSR